MSHLTTHLIAYVMGRIHESRGDTGKAIALYKHGNIARPDAFWTNIRLGILYKKSNQLQDAEHHLARALVARPTSLSCLCALAMTREKRKEWLAASALYDRAIACLPTSGVAAASASASASAPVSAATLHYRRSVCLGALKRFDDAVEALQHCLALDKHNTGYLAKLADIRRKQNKPCLEIEALQLAIALKADTALWHVQLGDAQTALQQFDCAISAYERAIALGTANPSIHYKLGYACDRAGRLEDARRAYTSAIALGDTTNIVHNDTARNTADAQRFGIGALHQAAGRWTAAAAAYRTQCAANPLDAALQFRLGIALNHCLQWDDAARAYRIALMLRPHKSHWHYRLGLTLERQQQWGEAASEYASALHIETGFLPYWHYRHGYVLIQDGRFEEACVAFAQTQKNAVLMHDTGAHGPTMAASEAVARYGSTLYHLLIDTLSHDTTQAAVHHALGNHHERLQEWEDAVRCYRRACDRSDDYHATWYFRLGYALSMLGRFEEACRAFVQVRRLQRPHGLSEDKYKASAALQRSTDYTEYHDMLPLRDKVVVYESFQGASISCNPYAIFTALQAHPHFADWLHVWSINDRALIPEGLKGSRNIVFVCRDSDLYLRYLTTARYLINNNSFPDYFICREGQSYLNTWHGTPLKVLGKAMHEGFVSYRNVARNFLSATHIVSPNRHTSSVLMECHDIKGLYTGLLAETGYPRVDATLRTSPDRLARLYERLSLRSRKESIESVGNDEGSRHKPVVLYAPTWRGVHTEASFDVSRLLEDISMIEESGARVLFRGHILVESLVKAHVPADCIVPSDLDTNELLSVVDVLITDYSSIAFDFLATGRPIIYYIYDLEDYQAHRGLSFSMDKMPGEKCRCIGELSSAVGRALAACKPGMHTAPCIETIAAQAAFCPLDDGHATQRVIDLLFFGDRRYVTRVFNAPADEVAWRAANVEDCAGTHANASSSAGASANADADNAYVHIHDYADASASAAIEAVVPKKSPPSVLIYAGPFLHNGITTSCQNLLRHLDSDTCSITIAVDPHAVGKHPDRVEQFAQLPEDTRVLARAGSMVLTLEERFVLGTLASEHGLPSEAMWTVYRQAFQREFRRMFGFARFDVLVHFEGYNRFWLALFGSAEDAAPMRKVTYLHNDMHSEWREKYPSLESNFRLYAMFDKLLSVSDGTSTLNANRLTPIFDLPPSRFDFCDNVQDKHRILSGASKPITDETDARRFAQPGIKLLTMGRLSVEKDQGKLIRAFSTFRRWHPDAQLFILGDGPLHRQLTELISALALTNHVHLLGQKANPFAYLARADCFVLPSNHEGQPMVLLEALVLGKPIIATDIVGSRSVLGPYGGLVPNSEDGLLQGLLAFAKAPVPLSHFDIDVYQANALQMFYTRCVGLSADSIIHKWTYTLDADTSRANTMLARVPHQAAANRD